MKNLSLLTWPLITLAFAGAVSAQSAADRAIAVSRTAATPEDTYGPLFRAVQLAHVFPDNKAFADLIPRDRPKVILAEFRSENPQGREALAGFVARHFRVQDYTTPSQLPLREHIKALWPLLAKPPLAVVPGSSSLELPNAFVVAGGRFREMYYWDSYFTMLGLRADGEQPLIESMLANFVSLVERFGHVPNGTRSYYLSRSQPPFLALMMDLSEAQDQTLQRRRLEALKTEHAYWMAGATCLDATGACQHVIRMPDGALLNRYWDARVTPRDEAFALDLATARNATPRPAPSVYRDLRAGAESGWDFSSRWFKDGKTAATIHTTDIAPIDLNSLIWNLETSIARRCLAAGDLTCTADFVKRANVRKVTITKYLWSQRENRFADWDRSSGRPTASINAGILYPLFVGLATPEQADVTAKLTEARLLAPGGLRTTIVHTGEQWDEPNGWAPLLWIAVNGLDRYKKYQLANDLANRWLKTVSTFYACTGRMVEKYDVERGQAGGGGEYPVQDGFGWTNGVTRALMDRPALDPAVTVKPPQSACAPKSAN
jgi:alpha,alpha-trehalase